MRKICPHIERGTSQPLGRPPVVKLVNVDAAYVRKVRGLVGPDTLIDVRWTQANDYQPLDYPARRAREFFERYLPDMIAMTDELRDTRIVFEGYNEIPDSHAPSYALFEVERLARMHTVGLRSSVDNSGVGCRNDYWHIVKRMVDAMHKGDVYGIHDYAAVPDDLDNEWYCARWRRTDVLDGVPTIVTEFGFDVIDDRRRRGLWPGGAGWQKNYNAEEFLDFLRRGDALYCQFPNVLGACVYGINPADDKWADFDPSLVWPQVVAEQETWDVPTQPEHLATPIPGARVSQPFGVNQEYYSQWGIAGHNGVDLASPNSDGAWEWHGVGVQSVSSGRAVIGRSDGYGLYVYVFGDDADWLYAHLAQAAIESNEQVEPGQVIGYAGYSGNTEPPGIRGTHLHWGKRPRPYQWGNGYNGYVDPLG